MKKLLRILLIGPVAVLSLPVVLLLAWRDTRCWKTVASVPKNIAEAIYNGEITPIEQ